jgi:hypothetical protein|tara:strand:- start:3292 stop:3447 length:156 start_codon:yes stop_codon:yes gene_type:complete
MLSAIQNGQKFLTDNTADVIILFHTVQVKLVASSKVQVDPEERPLINYGPL